MYAKTSSIRATSRASVKVGESYYTLEYSEERLIPEIPDTINLEEERAELWELCNSEVDKQILDILKTYHKK